MAELSFESRGSLQKESRLESWFFFLMVSRYKGGGQALVGEPAWSLPQNWQGVTQNLPLARDKGSKVTEKETLPGKRQPGLTDGQSLQKCSGP